MKVQVYVKKLSYVCSLWNIKFYDHESYNILWEEVYKEKFLIWQDVSSLKTKLPIILFKLKWLFCNENTYILYINFKKSILYLVTL